MILNFSYVTLTNLWFLCHVAFARFCDATGDILIAPSSESVLQSQCFRACSRGRDRDLLQQAGSFRQRGLRIKTNRRITYDLLGCRDRTDGRLAKLTGEYPNDLSKIRRCSTRLRRNRMASAVQSMIALTSDLYGYELPIQIPTRKTRTPPTIT